jgi:hypothetical protein
LELPLEACIHLAFHVSCLKRKLGQHISPLPTLPPIDKNGEIKLEPKTLVDRRLSKKRGRAVTEVLVKWKGAPIEDNTWEILWELQLQYPHLVGKVL